MRELLTVFLTVFVAEIGDKTQLATMLFATDRSAPKVGVFLAAAAALTASSAIAVIAGSLVNRFASGPALKIAAGAGFIAVGIWTLLTASRS